MHDRLMEKDFEQWHVVKKSIEQRVNLPLFQEREIWWCSIGCNIGFETCGKGQEFWRPVLVLTKHNRHSFFGLPLGSARKIGSQHHFPLDFNGRSGSIFVTQGRTFSSRRLSNKIGKIPETVFAEILQCFKDSL